MSIKANKTNHIGIRSTDAEKLDWELIAHREGLKTSQLARRLLNSYSNSYGSSSRSPLGKSDGKPSQREFNLQVARISNNQNQIARWANTYKGAAEATQVIASLAKIESSLLALNYRAG